jgi:predicted outer membrane protein
MIKVSVKHLPLWLALAVPLAGCETAASQISSSGTIGSADADFVTAAYSIAQLDEQAGKLAGQMSAEAQVLYPNLQGALRVEGKPAPTSPPPQVTAEVQTLSGLKGSAFDKQFVADELAAHKQAVAILQKEEAATKDGAMKNQVETELPAVQGNLATLQVLSSSLSPSQSS